MSQTESQVWVTNAEAGQASIRYHTKATCRAKLVQSGEQIPLADAEDKGFEQCFFCYDREQKEALPRSDRRVVASTRNTSGKRHLHDPDSPVDDPRPWCGLLLQNDRAKWKLNEKDVWPNKDDCKRCLRHLRKAGEGE